MSKNSQLIYQQKVFNGIARDFGTGKQPDNTVYDATNVVYDREAGSLVVRYPNENAVAVPAGITSFTHLLSRQVTYPSATDMLIAFTNAGIYQYPYFRLSSTATNGWQLITENKTVASFI